MTAEGRFEISVVPEPLVDEGDAVSVGSFRFTKTYEGAISGTSAGAMLTAVTGDGPQLYTAVERFTGTIDGRTGTIVLAHSGDWTGDGTSAPVRVVPTSGTGELAGATGGGVLGSEHVVRLDLTFPD